MERQDFEVKIVLGKYSNAFSSRHDRDDVKENRNGEALFEACLHIFDDGVGRDNILEDGLRVFLPI